MTLTRLQKIQHVKELLKELNERLDQRIVELHEQYGDSELSAMDAADDIELNQLEDLLGKVKKTLVELEKTGIS